MFCVSCRVFLGLFFRLLFFSRRLSKCCGRRPACLYIAFAAVHGPCRRVVWLVPRLLLLCVLGAPASLLLLCVRPGSRSGGLCARVITMCFLCSEGLRRGSARCYYYVFCVLSRLGAGLVGRVITMCFVRVSRGWGWRCLCGGLLVASGRSAGLCWFHGVLVWLLLNWFGPVFTGMYVAMLKT